jgi:hypothetical protein
MSAGEKLSNRISSDMYKTNQCYFPEALITKMPESFGAFVLAEDFHK